MINVLLYIKETAYKAILRRRDGKNYTPTRLDKLLFTHGDMRAVEAQFRRRTKAAKKDVMLSIYPETLAEVRAIPASTIIGAWDFDNGLPVGKRFGTKLDPEGNTVEDRKKVEGTAREPTKAEGKDFQPDEVTYSTDVDNPIELSRTRPTAFDPSKINVISGQAARVF